MVAVARDARVRANQVESTSWSWFVGVGAVVALLGLLASLNLVTAAIAASYVVGVAMLVSGFLMLVQAFGVRGWGWAVFWVLSGLLYIAAAAMLLSNPLFSARLLTLFIAISLGLSGVMRLMIALWVKQSGRGWLALSGVVSLLVAGVIGSGWPANGAWMLGLILAIDLIFQGTMLMLIGVALRMRPEL